MKKMSWALIIALGSLTLGGVTAFAANVGVITLMGSVGTVNEIVITQHAIAADLDILEGESAALVATVEESSNSPTGYTIFMNSMNDSNLINTEDDTESTSYTLSYDGAAPVSLSTADMAVKTVGTLTGLVTNMSDVVLNVAGNADAASGAYTDLITVSIAAN